MARVSVIGVPDSMGSYAAGLERAPAALRAAGLIDVLAAAGLEVHDEGDLPTRIWRPDQAHPYAQNVEQVVACLVELGDRVFRLLDADGTVLVLGGNCTIALSVMAGLRRLGTGTPGLLYVDRHFDLNTPASTADGALDWMGLAHGLALPGCVDDLADAFGSRPLLQPDQVAWLGVDSRFATDWEREQASRMRLYVQSSESLITDPMEVAAAALTQLPTGPLAVHLDVDVLDFTDAPLAENTDGRNTGPSLDRLGEALRVVGGDPRLRTLSIGELNPTRAAGDAGALRRFIDVLVAVLDATGR